MTKQKQSKNSSLQLSQKLPNASDITHIALQLSALSSRLALEDRTLVNHITGRPENVAEHSAMLAIVAPAIAEAYYPELDANLVCRFASIHDAIEAYTGDITTHDIDEKGLRQKAKKEAQGLAQLREDFATLSSFVKLVNQYEEQKIAEARFVRVIDKWMPVLVHFSDKGATVRSYTNPEKLVSDYEVHAKRLRQQFPDFPELVDVRIELTKLVGRHLF